jgi:hypothetical protein
VASKLLFKSPQIANQQILGLIPQLQIRQYASPQIANPRIFNVLPQIANSQISVKYCTTLFQNSPKFRFVLDFSYVQILISALYAIFGSRKSK